MTDATSRVPAGQLPEAGEVSSHTQSHAVRVELSRLEGLHAAQLVLEGLGEGEHPYGVGELARALLRVGGVTKLEPLPRPEVVELARAALKDEPSARCPRECCRDVSQPEGLLYDVEREDAARILGCSVRTVQRYIARGELAARPAADTGRALLCRSELDAFHQPRARDRRKAG